MNEFLAGEDISEENIVKIAEDNLIQVAKDSKAKQKNLKVIIAVMLLITVLTVSVLGSMIFRRLMLMCDKVTPQYDRQSPLLFRTKGHSIRRVHDFMLYLKY